MPNYVLQIDLQDNPIQIIEKLQAHETGTLHRAFSVFVHNNAGEMLLQKRQVGKYHSGGLWTNACCSHPITEDICMEAAERLQEEMGFSCKLTELGTFVYRQVFENGLTEYELDHVLIGWYNGQVNPNPEEASDFVWKSIEEIAEELRLYPERYTAWFVTAFPIARSYLNQ